ncbi:hypothetical protein I6F07_33405, partial [Ensifer sp. IC4062]
ASIGGSITGNLNRADTTVNAAFKLFAVPGVLPPGIATKFDNTIAATGSVATGEDGSVRLSGLEVRSGTLDASGTVTLADGALTADIEGNLPDLGRLIADARGAAAIRASISGPLNELGIKAEMTSSGATLAGRTLE